MQPISRADRAWARVLHQLRTFRGEILVFAFSDSAVYDAGTAPIYRAPEVSIFKDGVLVPKLSPEPAANDAPAPAASTTSPSQFSPWFRGHRQLADAETPTMTDEGGSCSAVTLHWRCS
jgi:hypothetical protein